MVNRCPWAKQPLDILYHDQEWGKPVHDDNLLFESLILGGAQAGLSWSTILKRRDGYRTVFDQFDAEKIVRYTKKNIEKILQDPRIIRNRLKVLSTVSNAKAFLLAQEKYGSFSHFLWEFVDHTPIVNQWRTPAEVPAYTPVSDRLSKALKKAGFSFVGTTICYAFMQAVGMVNDHLRSCFCHPTYRRQMLPGKE